MKILKMFFVMILFSQTIFADFNENIKSMIYEDDEAEQVEYILKKDPGSVDINAKNTKGKTLLILAIQNIMWLKRGKKDLSNNTRIIKAFLQWPGIDINLVDADKRTPLYHAVHSDSYDSEILDLLLTNNNINVNEPDQYGETPLELAYNQENESAVTKLLKHPNIDLNQENRRGVTFLQEVISSSASVFQQKIIEALINNDKVDVNVKDNDEITPLMKAISKNDLKTLKLLLQRKDINVDLQDDKGEAPLFFAIYKNNPEMVEVLLAKKADVNLRNKKGLTPIVIAYLKFITNDSEDAKKIYESLKKTNYNKDDLKWVEIVSSGDIKKLDTIKDINQPDGNGFSLLDWAMILGKLDIFTALIKKNAVAIVSSKEDVDKFISSLDLDQLLDQLANAFVGIAG